jgi:ABC-type nitrate/sulfonate/bicarbonate transport system ATPase subunit
MDEPFAALDAQTRAEMQGLLLRLWELHRTTIVFITHDIEEGLLLADRALILTKRPAWISHIIQVPLDRPRSYDTVMTPEFVALRAHARDLMRTDAQSLELLASASAG